MAKEKMEHPVKRTFKRIDLFPYDLQGDEKKVHLKRQIFGAIVSILIVMAFTGYSIYKLEQFINNPSSQHHPLRLLKSI